MSLPCDPIAPIGLEGFAAAMRQGKITSEQVVSAYLARIKTLDPLLGAYEYVDYDGAMNVARAMDSLLASGIDLGPLMGLPVSVKDIFVLNGKAPNAGSNFPLHDRFSGEDAAFIKALKGAGCVILGTTRMVEFALGITGHSIPRGTPWNPWDENSHRLPGGSSSGAGVALSAGLCALSIGTDTGGSVRVPAAMCGLFGLKTTAGRWPNKGAFPLDPQTDTVGLITRSARDARVAFRELDSRLSVGQVKSAQPKDVIKVGIPNYYMLDGLSSDVEEAFNRSLSTLQSHGVEVSSVDIPNLDGRERYFPVAMPAHLLSWLGVDEFMKYKEEMDPTVRSRIETGVDIKAHDYLKVCSERKESVKLADDIYSDVNLVVSPTTQTSALLVSDLKDPGKSLAAAMGMTRNTQQANYFDWCAVTLPVGLDSCRLPVGIQLNARGMTEHHLLDMAVHIESLIGQSLFPKSFRGVELY